jgi:predicted Zn-dependent protease
MLQFLKHSRRWRRIRQLPGRLYDTLVNTGQRLVSPIEDLFRWIGDRIFRVSDGFTGVESAAFALGRLLLWPARMCRQLVTGFFALIFPRSLRETFARQLRIASRRARPLAPFARTAAQALNLDRLALWLAKLTKPLWYPVLAVCSFAQAWINTRRYKRLALAVPVCAFLSLLPLMKGWMWYRGDQAAAARYRTSLSAAQEKKDYAKVQLLERKLAQLGQDTRLSEFNTAKLLERDARIGEAYERMQHLAPLNMPGYPPAHYWIIQHLLQKKLNVPPDDTFKLIRVHLDLLTKLGAKGPELDLLHANCLVHEGKARQAAELLKPLIYRNRSAAVERLKLDIALHQMDEARQDAKAVREQMQKHAAADGLNASDYQYWTLAEGVLGDSNRVRELLGEWIKLDPENDAAKKQLAAIYLREFQQVLSSPQPVVADLALRIQNSFALSEPPESAKEQLALMYQQKYLDETLQELFDRLYNTPNLSPALAELLGTSAAVGGEWDRAESWLRQSLANKPENAAAWNNLACVLLQHPDPPLAEALAAASRAVEADNKDFRFRQTRGQILLRLERYQDAVTDLEFALNGMPNVPTIHQSLAKAYDALGNHQLAAFHKRNAN